jgi:hypothetical protein
MCESRGMAPGVEIELEVESHASELCSRPKELAGKN